MQRTNTLFALTIACLSMAGGGVGCQMVLDVGELPSEDVVYDAGLSNIEPADTGRQTWPAVSSPVLVGPDRAAVRSSRRQAIGDVDVWPSSDDKAPLTRRQLSPTSFDEQCNDVDDDLDGVVDEGLRNACGECGVLPEEICDGEDNDCDGEIDEGHLNACGACGPVPADVCDGEDNDCDGEVDEGVDNACGACGPVPQEICDGEDNDCDGEADEGLLNACGQCGEVPAEVCDGIDNDCDGEVDEGDVCPCPTAESAESIYLLCGGPDGDAEQRADRAKTWVSARRTCRDYGFELTTIDTAEENAFVFAVLDAAQFEHTWLGLTDRDVEDVYLWADGTPVEGYINWDRRDYGRGHNDEPNDGGESGEDCGVMMLDSVRESFWDDKACDTRYSYICERALP